MGCLKTPGSSSYLVTLVWISTTQELSCFLMASQVHFLVQLIAVQLNLRYVLLKIAWWQFRLNGNNECHTTSLASLRKLTSKNTWHYDPFANWQYNPNVIPFSLARFAFSSFLFVLHPRWLLPLHSLFPWRSLGHTHPTHTHQCASMFWQHRGGTPRGRKKLPKKNCFWRPPLGGALGNRLCRL